jgi:hypothetical protein
MTQVGPVAIQRRRQRRVLCQHFLVERDLVPVKGVELVVVVQKGKPLWVLLLERLQHIPPAAAVGRVSADATDDRLSRDVRCRTVDDGLLRNYANLCNQL